MPVKELAGTAVLAGQIVMLQGILQPVGPPKHDKQVLERAKLYLAGRRALPALCMGRCEAGQSGGGRLVGGMARMGMAGRKEEIERDLKPLLGTHHGQSRDNAFNIRIRKEMADEFVPIITGKGKTNDKVYYVLEGIPRGCNEKFQLKH